MKMKLKNHLLMFVIPLILTNSQNISAKTSPFYSADFKSAAQTREFYQLKIYTFDTEEQLTTTDKYLKEAYLPALKRLNIKNIGVFKLRPIENDTVKKIFVLIPFSSLAQFETLENGLIKDQIYMEKGKDYISASFENPPYKRIESVLMKAFENMPVMKITPLDGPREDRIYELRSYQSPTEAYFSNKLEMFNNGGEIKLFEKLQFNAVFYGEVISGSIMPNLMYMTTFQNQISRDEHWKNFVDSPEWKELSAVEKYKNNVSHIDITFIYPTEYSDY